MNQQEVREIFERQAAGYDRQWARMAPIRECLHLLIEPILSALPQNAHLLCVGVGTGAEISHLARAFPGWRFTAVDPSGAMLDVCRQRAKAEGFEARCRFHEGYVPSLPVAERFDGATCFLVSQFILDPAERTAFFRDIAVRLQPGAPLVSSDLASHADAASYDTLLALWFQLMNDSGIQGDALEKMRATYARDVAVLPPAVVESLIRPAGFEAPVQFFQAGLIRAWHSRTRRSA